MWRRLISCLPSNVATIVRCQLIANSLTVGGGEEMRTKCCVHHAFALKLGVRASNSIRSQTEGGEVVFDEAFGVAAFS